MVYNNCRITKYDPFHLHTTKLTTGLVTTHMKRVMKNVAILTIRLRLLTIDIFRRFFLKSLIYRKPRKKIVLKNIMR